MRTYLKRKPKRTAVALVLAFTAATASARAGARGGGADGSAAGLTSGDSTGKSAPSNAADIGKTSAPDPASPIAIELQELKDAVEAQTKQFAEQSRELESERAALRHELEAIEKLESKLRVTSDSASSSPLPAPAIAPTSQPSSRSVVLSSPAQNAVAKGADQGAAPLSFKIGRADFTPGGYVDLIGTFRSVNIGSGLSTNLTTIPYNNSLPAGRLSEFRFNPQGSRISLKVDTSISQNTSVTAYLETDFAGYQPANAFTSTNSDGLRLRSYWVDVTHGKWELLTGQSWSLLTPTRTGLPADVFTASRLDTSYIAGLVFARQPGVRVVYHATNWWMVGVALENPQQFAPSSVIFPGASGYFAGQFDNGSSSSSASSATTNTTTPNLHPDIIAKTSFDWKVGGRAFHAEVGGVARSFRVYNNLVTPNATSTITGGGGVANLNFELFKGFHLIADSAYGDGIGRYIGALGPDVIVKKNGALSGVHAESGVAGFEWQATPKFLVDAYYGGAYFARNYSVVSSTSTVGFGFPGSANTNNRSYQDGTIGLVSTLWSSPSYGRLQFIAQPAYVVRTPWSVPAGSPKNAHVFITYVDLRYVLP